MNRQPDKAVGIDIGGTKIAIAAVNEDGTIAVRTSLPTQSELGFKNGLQRIRTSIDQVLAQAGWEPSEWTGIGIGCAGPVKPALGTIENPFTLPGWESADIVAALQQHYRKPVFLENDADAAALGEWFASGHDPSLSLLMLTFGTGVGGGFIRGGEVYRGACGEHPEIGHLAVDPDGPECCCGTRGCLESLASGTAIAEAGKPHGFKTSRAVFDAHRNGDSQARRIIRTALDATARATWSLIHTFLPDAIVLGGGIMDEHFHPFAEASRQSIAAATQIPGQEIEVRPARMGNDAGLVGAASLALRTSAPKAE